MQDHSAIELQEARQLIFDNLQFAKRLSRSFFSQYLPSASEVECEDLQGAAYLALCQAAMRFKNDRGADFKTFSYKRIRGEMFDVLGSVYSSSKYSSFEDSFLRRENYLEQQLRLSLENQQLCPENRILQVQLMDYLRSKVERLPKKQRRVISLRYFDGVSIAEISRVLALKNKSWIWKLHEQAINNLRNMIQLDLKSCRTKVLVHHYQSS